MGAGWGFSRSPRGFCGACGGVLQEGLQGRRGFCRKACRASAGRSYKKSADTPAEPGGPCRGMQVLLRRLCRAADGLQVNCRFCKQKPPKSAKNHQKMQNAWLRGSLRVPATCSCTLLNWPRARPGGWQVAARAGQRGGAGRRRLAGQLKKLS